MPEGASFLSRRFLAILLTEQRVLCLKITCGIVFELATISSSCFSSCKGIQFIGFESIISVKIINE